MASPINAAAIEAALAKPDAPPGITLSFMEQSRDLPAVIAILFVGTLVFLIMALRCYARTVIIKEFGLDDWLALLTLVPYAAFISLCIVLIHLGSGRHFVYIQYVLDNPTINMTEVLDFCAHIIYTTALLICRLSGLAFYARISSRHAKLTYTIRAVAVLMVAGYLPQLFLIIFHCLPVTRYWPYAFQAEVNRFTCLEWGTVYVTNSTISLVCDMVLFITPMAIITLLKAGLARKMQLSFILMPGLLVIAILCARMYLVVDGQWEADESWSYDTLLAVEVAEIGSTVIALSIPSLKPFFANHFATLDPTFISSASFSRSKGGISERNNGRNIELERRYGRAESQVAIVEGLNPDIKQSVRSSEERSTSRSPRDYTKD